MTRGSGAAYSTDLIASGVLYADERVDYFYFVGLFSPLTEGVILSDRAVVYYYEDTGGEMIVFDIPFGDIASFELTDPGGLMSDALLRIDGYEPGAWIMIPLPPIKNGPALFMRALEGRLARF